jgi:hypothetical protein
LKPASFLAASPRGVRVVRALGQPVTITVTRRMYSFTATASGLIGQTLIMSPCFRILFGAGARRV